MSEYIPYGKEWEKEMMRFKKIELIKLYRDACLNNARLDKEKETK